MFYCKNCHFEWTNPIVFTCLNCKQQERSNFSLEDFLFAKKLLKSALNELKHDTELYREIERFIG